MGGAYCVASPSIQTTLLSTMGKEKNIFDFFSQSAIQQFKEAFGIMDINKNGILEADDLVQAFTNVGKSVSSGEAQAMLDETTAPVNFPKMVLLFADKMAGGSDDDDVIQILRGFRDGRQDRRRDVQAFPHDIRRQVLRTGMRRRFRRVPD